MSFAKTEFDNFMRRAYPDVERGSDQWDTMELVWASGIFATLVYIREEPCPKQRAKKFLDIMEDTMLFCSLCISKLKGTYKNALNLN